MNNTENQMLIIFGASGDLTARKLIPALFHLYKAGELPENFVVLGTSRTNLSDEDFRNSVVTNSKYLNEALSEEEQQFIGKFTKKIFYEPIGDSYDVAYKEFGERIAKLNKEFGTENRYIFYLSTPPNIYELIAGKL
ncbi:MAG: glucose-6-phosphate dehydrogenase, partial [Eudoraea sp.]|nr:glucose-6-phosphate dehydrogenase [Eudoraea sp.]